MGSIIRPATLGVFLVLLLSSDLVIGGGGIALTIKNDTTDNIRVTVNDENARPAQTVLPGQSINGFATVSISVMADESGQGHVSWTAITVDPARRMCGHGDHMIQDGDTVNVSASTSCASQ